MISHSPNQYYILLKKQKTPIPWNPSNPDLTINIDCSLKYFGHVFEEMEKTLETGGLTVYLVWEHLNWLPSYGENVVVVLLGDEFSKIPRYFNRVRAVFKCYGIHPTLGCNPVLEPSLLNFMTLVHFVRNIMIDLPGRLGYAWYLFMKRLLGFGIQSKRNIFDIPLGYYKQLDLPIKNFSDRLYDVFFDGSVINKFYPKWSLKYWLRSPKTISRSEMLTAMEKASQEIVSAKFELATIPSFDTARKGDGQSYSERMMNAKICLVPRGTTLETYRFFEALRYGCIVITQSLPARWFYDGSPVIQVKRWDDLPVILKSLLADENLMQKKHQESLDWWTNKCSAEVVGKFLAQTLNEIALLQGSKKPIALVKSDGMV